jgi:hypothetical protein
VLEPMYRPDWDELDRWRWRPLGVEPLRRALRETEGGAVAGCGHTQENRSLAAYHVRSRGPRK